MKTLITMTYGQAALAQLLLRIDAFRQIRLATRAHKQGLESEWGAVLKSTEALESANQAFHWIAQHVANARQHGLPAVELNLSPLVIEQLKLLARRTYSTDSFPPAEQGAAAAVLMSIKKEHEGLALALDTASDPHEAQEHVALAQFTSPKSTLVQ